ncbi:ABC transporter ATP-binding protein [Leucobacter sp. OLCS4]|uniref:ABC transporter ATP-binding protein n=1 Tax=Leucobacter sp. OLCS4 TaxID=1914918 RepID=UPI000C1750A5|nr:ABC transporter ATP-binding protein [Leucobacter sp. OLCS4]
MNSNAADVLRLTAPDAAVVSGAAAGAPTVSIRGLCAEYRTRLGVAPALADIDLTVSAGERLAIIGESGSGKSTVSQAIGRLLPRACTVTAGTVEVLGQRLDGLAADRLRALRREALGFIPQDPIASLDPTMRIGRQLQLALQPLGKPVDAPALTQLLERVRILEPARVLRLFPHEVSGGMAQRIAIALAMAREPRILIADEPTASLDAQVRDEILALLFEVVESSGASLIWISHDLGAVRRWCDRVVVMHGGRIVEDGPTANVLDDPQDDYTRTLVAAMPTRPHRPDRTDRADRPDRTGPTPEEQR